MTETSAFDRILYAAQQHGSTVRRNSDGRSARVSGPGHSSVDDSVLVTDQGIRARVWSFAGESDEDVLAAWGLTVADLFNEPLTTLRYPDGRVVIREPRKDRTDANGKRKKAIRQTGNTGGRLSYRADRLANLPTGTIVLVVEGEPDVHAAESVGALADTGAQGAANIGKTDFSHLRGMKVTIVRHKDSAGEKFAATVVEKLTGVAAAVRVVEAAAGNDLSDHIAADRTLDELVPVDVDTADPRPRLFRATDLVAAEQPKWLARNWIPFAAIALLVGDEGIGKSLFWVLVVSSVTTGRACPELGIPARTPRHVIIVITEDEWASVVLPRLLVAGAALDKISVICTERDGSGAPIFPRDIHLVRDSGLDPALVIVDAWLDTVASGLSVRDPQQARQALHPWKEAATVTGAAVLLLTHTNRVPSANPRDKYGATGELRKKARMTLFAQVDDDGLLIGPEKANSAGKIAATRFAIDPIQHFPATEDHDGTVPLLRIVGDSGQTIREHIGEQFDDDRGEDRTEKDSAIRWLREYLEQEGPSVKSATVKAAAKKVGITDRTLARARGKLKVVVSYEGMPAVTVWSLPTDPTVVDLSPDEYTVVPPQAPYHSDVAQQAPLGISPGHTVVPPTENTAESPVVPTPEIWHNSGITATTDRCAACVGPLVFTETETLDGMPEPVTDGLCGLCVASVGYVTRVLDRTEWADKHRLVIAHASSTGARDKLDDVLTFLVKSGRITSSMTANNKQVYKAIGPRHCECGNQLPPGYGMCTDCIEKNRNPA